MKREIKFRAWDFDRKQMIVNFNPNENAGKHEILYHQADDTFFCGGFMRSGDWQEPTLMQYTGLKDKNGVEIYEGDLIKILEGHPDHLEKVFKVDFQKGSFGLIQEGFISHTSFGHYFKCAVDNYVYYNYSHADGSCFEVIGNIHENPDLIK